MSKIQEALDDLKIDGHTQRGVYNAIAILESIDKEKIIYEIIDELDIKSEEFSKIYDAVEYTINKIL